MSSEHGGVDRQVSQESTHEPDETRTEEEKSLKAEIPSRLPSCLDGSINEGADRWFQYQGELLFDRAEIRDISKRLFLISEMEFERAENVETEIQWWKTIDFIDEVEQRWEKATEDHSFLVAVPTPNIEQQPGPRRAIIKLDYHYHKPEIRTVREWKRDQILATLREFDYWVYHTKVIKPALESVAE
jgi:hypothetical protein